MTGMRKKRAQQRMLQRRLALLLAGTLAVVVQTVCLLTIAALDGQGVLRFLPAAVFWLALLTEVVALLCCNLLRKKQAGEALGLITFASSREAEVVDICLVTSGGLLALLRLFQLHIGVLTALFMGLTWFLLHLHSIVNGCNYQGIKADCLHNLNLKNTYKGARER